MGTIDGLEGDNEGATDGPDGVYVGAVVGALLAFTITVPGEKAVCPKEITDLTPNYGSTIVTVANMIF